jgi:DNA-binding GntR family transcriptional regulator
MKSDALASKLRVPKETLQTRIPEQGLGRISVRSVPETVAQALRDAIIRGTLKPGDRLLEQKLASTFGIGQPTLREALRQLENQGFVRKIPQRGTYVTRLSAEDFRKILEVRMALEALAIGNASMNMRPNDAEELAAIVKEMGKAAQAFDLNTFHKRDVDFHRKVWTLASNEYLERALEATAFQLFAFVLLQREPGSRNEFLAATEQHKQILAGLFTHDPHQARKAFVEATLKFWSEHHQVKLGHCSVLTFTPPATEENPETMGS